MSFLQVKHALDRKLECSADAERRFQGWQRPAVLDAIEMALGEARTPGEVVLAKVPGIEDSAEIVAHVDRPVGR